MKESGLLCTFGRGSGAGSSELAPAHVGRKRLPVDIARAERLLDRIRFYSLLAQLVPDPDGSLPSFCVMMHEARHEPFVGHESLRAELLHDPPDRIRVVTLSDQLAFELQHSVLAPGQQAYRR